MSYVLADVQYKAMSIHILSEEFPKQLDQGEVLEILDQAKAPEWHEVMLTANVDIFEMLFEESASYSKHLTNLGKIP